MYQSNQPQRGIGFMSKRGVNVNINEIARYVMGCCMQASLGLLRGEALCSTLGASSSGGSFC